MNARNQRLCAWAGPAAAIGWLIGLLLLARFIPPIAPNLGAAEVAARYAENPIGIRAGMVFVLAGGALYGAWTAVITVQLKRIEGRSPVMAYTQLALGAAFILVFVIPSVFWQAAAFRPLDNIEITQRLNDLAWLGFLIPVPVITVQGLAISLAIFADRSPRPVFPRWLGWFNLWAQLVFLPGTLIPFFKDGPLAWNGLLSFWIPVAVFTAWMITLSRMLFVAIADDEREHERRRRPEAVATAS
ncbi:hypothetical protein H7I53_15570 [Mycolicibacterium pulveris]|uniref:DUF4386 domain-containing protein n=1 Tax=Mycolicibacterium pulveris TaxID=36813 RepID=A0A7I7UH60_MYCPV|nr:hypothetical protein [Mycolicibacterium pulveris]MCV6981633.1 hypothetical protein [Mycolicibacterium pulveris]BBY80211.1 hypothetical protein MPUL_13690 [Mycolicibacterium pulveris]